MSQAAVECIVSVRGITVVDSVLPRRCKFAGDQAIFASGYWRGFAISIPVTHSTADESKASANVR